MHMIVFTVVTKVLACMVQLYKFASEKPTPIETNADLPQPTCSYMCNYDATSLVKRPYSTRSPHENQILNSPKPKKARRSRTGVENQAIAAATIPTQVPQMQELQQTDKPTMTMEIFELQKEEKMSLA